MPFKVPFNEEILFLDPKSTLPLFETCGAGITHMDSSYKIMRPNGEPFFVIEYILSGQGIITFKDSIYSPETHDSYILPPRTPVEYHSLSKAPWEKIWLNIGGPLPEHLFQAYNLQGKILFKNCSIEDDLIACIDAFRTFTYDSVLKISLALHRIFAKLSAHHESNANPWRNTMAVKLRQYCETHWREPVRLEELAQTIGRSQAQTLRIFTRAWGCTPEQWLQKHRFEIASHYISNTNRTIREISELIGFKDEFYFSNWFKVKSGMAPGKYRKAKRNLKS